MTCSFAPWPRTRRTTFRVSHWPTIFSESDTHTDQTRADFIRAQCAGADADARALFFARAWEWAGLCAPPDGWLAHAEQALTHFERGFVTRLTFPFNGSPVSCSLRRLFASEPVAEAVFDASRCQRACAVQARALLPFARPVTVRASGGSGGRQDAFLAALLSSPVMSSASTAVLAGLFPGRTGRPLVGWLAKSPFLGRLRVLNLGCNGFGDVEARELASSAWLANVAHLSLVRNRIGDAGALALTRSPHLRNITRLDVAENRLTDAGREVLLARFGSGVILGS